MTSSFNLHLICGKTFYRSVLVGGRYEIEDARDISWTDNKMSFWGRKDPSQQSIGCCVVVSTWASYSGMGLNLSLDTGYPDWQILWTTDMTCTRFSTVLCSQWSQNVFKYKHFIGWLWKGGGRSNMVWLSLLFHILDVSSLNLCH